MTKNGYIKRILASEFGFKNVSVRQDTGTASGWVSINIDIKRDLALCHCEPNTPYCGYCRSQLNEAHKKADEIIHAEPLEFSTYYSDDGYNTERECVMIQTSFIQEDKVTA